MNTAPEVKHRLTPEGKFALLLIVCEFVTFIPFLVFNKPEIGLVVCISLAMVLIAVRATWDLHNESWYWLTTAFALAIQAPLIFHFPWSNRAYRGTALLPFGMFEFLLIWGFIKLAAKTFSHSTEKPE